MAALEPETEPVNTFLTGTGFCSSDRLMDDREVFLSNLRKELRPEHDTTSEMNGTSLVDLVPTEVEVFEKSTVEVRKGQSERTYVTVSLGDKTLTAMICTTASGKLVCVNDTVLPLDTFLTFTSITKTPDNTLLADRSGVLGRAHTFFNTSVPLLLLAIQACGALAQEGAANKIDA